VTDIEWNSFLELLADAIILHGFPHTERWLYDATSPTRFVFALTPLLPVPTALVATRNQAAIRLIQRLDPMPYRCDDDALAAIVRGILYGTLDLPRSYSAQEGVWLMEILTRLNERYHARSRSERGEWL
jgi:hypothetical protein